MKRKILVVVHEPTLTGAPLAALRNASLILDSQLYDVDMASWAVQGSKLQDEVLQKLGRNLLDINSINFEIYDLVICHSAALMRTVVDFIKTGKKVLWWIHEDTHFFDVMGDARLLNLAFERATGLIFTSAHCAYSTFGHWVWKRNAKNVFVIPNCPDFTGDSTSYKDRSLFRVVHVAYLGIEKGTDRVLAVAKALEDHSDIDFTLVGRVRSTFENQMSDLPKNCKYLGEKSRDQTIDIMRQSHLLFHPTRLDNQPLVIVEAAQMGLDIISTFLPSVANYLDGLNGLKWLPDTEDELSIAIATSLILDIHDSMDSKSGDIGLPIQMSSEYQRYMTVLAIGECV